MNLETKYAIKRYVELRKELQESVVAKENYLKCLDEFDEKYIKEVRYSIDEVKNAALEDEKTDIHSKHREASGRITETDRELYAKLKETINMYKKFLEENSVLDEVENMLQEKTIENLVSSSDLVKYERSVNYDKS
jgi:hypothetical protein